MAALAEALRDGDARVSDAGVARRVRLSNDASASVFPNAEKASMVVRLTAAAEALGVGRVLVSTDTFGVSVGQHLDHRPVRSIIEQLELKGQDGQASSRSRLYIVHVCDVCRYVGTIIGSVTKADRDS